MTRNSCGFLLCLLTVVAPASAGELRVLNSRHYRIHTDLDAPLAEELSRRMDAMHDEYRRRLVDFRAAKDTTAFEVYLFKGRGDYMNFTGNRFPNTGGIFMSGRNLLAAFLEGQGRDTLRRTLQHEAFHQFAHKAIGPNLPVWLNEGIAQLFEEGLWTGQSFWLGQVPPRRVRQLQADIKSRRLVAFKMFMSMTHDQWAESLRGDPDRGATQYNQAWGMAHFLANAGGEAGKPKYRQRLVQLLKLIHEGESGPDAFREAFSDNLAGFQERFVEWARTLQATPEATMIEHQDILADMLTERLTRGETYDDIAAFRDAAASHHFRLHYKRGNIQWTTEEDPSVYFADLRGRQFARDQLYFSTRTGAPLPDMICRSAERFQLRTRFHYLEGNVEHEVVIEATK